VGDPALDGEVAGSTLKVLASILQGAQLRSDIDKLQIPLNAKFYGELIMATASGSPIDMGDGLTFTVVGPMKPEVKALHKKHQEWLEGLKEAGKTPADVLAAYVDKSVPNLSSIVVLADAGGKTMLLTGDARGDKILEGLELVGLLEPNKTMTVDLLKVPHHGSANNLDDDFFERVVAEHYVFSGNGEHGNPERESLEMLFKARGDADYQVHLTYPVAEIDVERKKDWDKERAKEQKRKETKPATKVRPKWSPKKHSLTELLADHPEFADKVQVVTTDKPHVIDLLDKTPV
jgi:hypothetical protein